jgi:class 3 adenylate cyclase
MGDINSYLEETRERAEAEMSDSIEIEPVQSFPKPSALAFRDPIWKKIDNCVVVAADLKGSTKISYARQDRIGARVYQASSGNCARILDHFGASFIDIQGDGVFGIFHGDKPWNFGIAAAFTLKSFSAMTLGPVIAEHFGEEIEELKETGLKIGMTDGTLLAKQIGVRGEHHEPVWAGKPVNYATKCAQAAESHGLLVTDRVFDRVADNDHVRFSCGCVHGEQVGQPAPMWEVIEVPELGEDSGCKLFASVTGWCAHHGNDFCDRILDGDGDRDDLPDDIAPLKIAAEEAAGEGEAGGSA